MRSVMFVQGELVVNEFTKQDGQNMQKLSHHCQGITYLMQNVMCYDVHLCKLHAEIITPSPLYYLSL